VGDDVATSASGLDPDITRECDRLLGEPIVNVLEINLALRNHLGAPRFQCGPSKN
jgi:K+-transporting ATPase c subunit